jgi:hypothetical protein
MLVSSSGYVCAVAVEWYDAECTLHFLEVFVSHFLVVPGRVVLGEIIRKVEFTKGPDEVELALLDYVCSSTSSAS